MMRTQRTSCSSASMRNCRKACFASATVRPCRSISRCTRYSPRRNRRNTPSCTCGRRNMSSSPPASAGSALSPARLSCSTEALAPLAEVAVVAPDRNKSGASNSLTLDVPLRVFESEPGVYFVPGTPTDCVHLAISGLFDFEHDMVVSGVNDGANLGDDVLYSGTVAAAVEGRFLGLPTIAVSLCAGTEGGGHFDTGAEVARLLVAQLLESPLEPTLILNVNVPDVPFAQLRGFRASRLGFRHRSAPVMRAKDPRGRPVYWVGPAGPEQDAGPGTDFDTVARGYVSVTPLQVDLTRHAALQTLGSWLGGIDG